MTKINVNYFVWRSSCDLSCTSPPGAMKPHKRGKRKKHTKYTFVNPTQTNTHTLTIISTFTHSTLKQTLSLQQCSYIFITYLSLNVAPSSDI